jgi:ABC-2 type transport system ATP-binding protein
VQQAVCLGGRLNPGWDAPYAERLVEAAALPATARVGSLAAGQRMRLALALALGKRPDLLVLDEPLSPLDPVARTEVVGTLMADAADRGTTVVMSSQVLVDIQDVCDHIIVLGDGGVRLAAEVDAAVAAHRLAAGATSDLAALDGLDVVQATIDRDEFTALVRTTETSHAGTLSWSRPNLDEVLLGYLRAGAPQPPRKVFAT